VSHRTRSSGRATPKPKGSSGGRSRTRTLYQRLGGASGLRALVDDLYERILADQALAPFFVGLDVAHLKKQQVDFLGAALGGPKRYRGRSMPDAHAHLGIAQAHFDAVAGHLVAALQSLEAPPEAIDEVVSIVAPLARSIVTVSTPEGTMDSNADRSGRFFDMLENAPINVMFADKDEFRIQYLNPASRETLKTLEQYLPCKAEEMEGQCVDIFHKDPSHQRRILSDPKNLPRRATIEVGPEVLDLLARIIHEGIGIPD